MSAHTVTCPQTAAEMYDSELHKTVSKIIYSLRADRQTDAVKADEPIFVIFPFEPKLDVAP